MGSGDVSLSNSIAPWLGAIPKEQLIGWVEQQVVSSITGEMVRSAQEGAEFLQEARQRDSIQKALAQLTPTQLWQLAESMGLTAGSIPQLPLPATAPLGNSSLGSIDSLEASSGFSSLFFAGIVEGQEPTAPVASQLLTQEVPEEGVLALQQFLGRWEIDRNLQQVAAAPAVATFVTLEGEAGKKAAEGWSDAEAAEAERRREIRSSPYFLALEAFTAEVNLHRETVAGKVTSEEPATRRAATAESTEATSTPPQLLSPPQPNTAYALIAATSVAIDEVQVTRGREEVREPQAVREISYRSVDPFWQEMAAFPAVPPDISAAVAMMAALLAQTTAGQAAFLVFIKADRPSPETVNKAFAETYSTRLLQLLQDPAFTHYLTALVTHSLGEQMGQNPTAKEQWVQQLRAALLLSALALFDQAETGWMTPEGVFEYLQGTREPLTEGDPRAPLLAALKSALQLLSPEVREQLLLKIQEFLGSLRGNSPSSLKKTLTDPTVVLSKVFREKQQVHSEVNLATSA